MRAWRACGGAARGHMTNRFLWRLQHPGNQLLTVAGRSGAVPVGFCLTKVASEGQVRKDPRQAAAPH